VWKQCVRKKRDGFRSFVFLFFVYDLGGNLCDYSVFVGDLLISIWNVWMYGGVVKLI